MYLYDSSVEIFEGRLVLLQFTSYQAFPDAFSFRLTNHLGLLEFSVVFCVEVAVLWRAKLAKASLQHFRRDITLRKGDASDQSAIIVDTC